MSELIKQADEMAGVKRSRPDLSHLFPLADDAEPLGGWKSVDSAPRDGTLCLYFSPGNPRASNFVACQPHFRIDCFQKDWPRARHQLPEAPYTHWQPLPPPPNEGERTDR